MLGVLVVGVSYLTSFGFIKSNRLALYEIFQDGKCYEAAYSERGMKRLRTTTTRVIGCVDE